MTDNDKKLRQAVFALKKISFGAGAYSQDRLTHAQNTIDDMKEIATVTLEAMGEDVPEGTEYDDYVYKRIQDVE